jgi:hypothetical protein
MYFDIIEANYAEGYKINLKFEDGSSGTADLIQFMVEGTVLYQLKNAEVFKKYEVEYGTLVWKKENIDIAPEALYKAATGKEIKYPRQNRAAS